MDDEKYSPEEFYPEWIGCQNKYTVTKILAIIIMDTFKPCIRLTDVAAACEAVCYSERSTST